MPVGGVLIGRDAACYFNESNVKLDGAANTPATWLAHADTKEALNLMDASENVDSQLVDSTTRAEARQGWAAEVSVIKNGEVTFDMRWQLDDPFTDLLLSAWDNQEAMTLAFFDRQKDHAIITFASGTTAPPDAGVTVTGGTSGATGEVIYVATASGTWTGGTALGYIQIKDLSGAFQDGENISWVGGSATGDDIATAQGLIANFSISLSKLEALTDIQKASVSCTVATYPEWYKVP